MKLCTVTLDLISPIHGRWVAAFTFQVVYVLPEGQRLGVRTAGTLAVTIGWETVRFFSETQPGEGGFHKKTTK